MVSAQLPAQRSSQTLVPVLLWLGLVGRMDLKTLPGMEQAGVLLVAPTSLQGRLWFRVTGCCSFLYSSWLLIFWLEMSVKARKTLVFWSLMCWNFMLFFSKRKEGKIKNFASVAFICCVWVSCTLCSKPSDLSGLFHLMEELGEKLGNHS